MGGGDVKDLGSPTELLPSDNNDVSDEGKVKMKKQLGLLEGVAIILGIIFGSGKLITKLLKSFAIITNAF